MPFDRTHVISYQSSSVTIPLSCTVSELLALTSQHFIRTPILQYFNMRVFYVFFVFKKMFFVGLATGCAVVFYE